MSIALVSLVLAARVLWALRAVTRTLSTCPRCHGAAVTSDPHGPCSHNPTGLRDCDACDGVGELAVSPYDAQALATRALARTAPAAAREAASKLALRIDTIARGALDFARLPLSPLVREAAHELGADLAGVKDLHEAAWRIAVAVARVPAHHWPDTYTRHAACGLADALEARDLGRAEECALWIVRPATAMDAALDHVRRAPHRVVCRACEHVVKTVDGEGDCPSCAAEMRLAADEAHAGYVAHLDAASPWGPSWDLADAFGAVA